jgi:carboxypeptidase T
VIKHSHHFVAATVVLVAALFAMPALKAESEVIQVHDVPREQIQQLRRLGDFWGIDRHENTVILFVTPRGRTAVEELGYAVDTDHRRTGELRAFRDVDRAAWRDLGMTGIPGFPCYRTVDETHADLAALATANPDIARWESIGETWLSAQGQPGGDDIHVLVIGNQQSPYPQAPLLIMGAQHARELTTAESAARFAEWLVEGYDNDATARWLVDHREIHIVAQQNPDGRRAVEQGQSMWRKNSNLNACPTGTPGVDLNRNSDYFWGDYSDGNTCSQIYRGTAPGSEPETQAIQNYMHDVFDNHWPSGTGNEPVPDDADGLFLSLHSFSELILFPWEGSGSGSANNAPNHDQLAWLGRKLGYFTGYQVGRDILYSAGGTTTDYAHSQFGVAAYTYEIGTSFQQSCSSFEQSIWPDILDSLIYAAKATELPYLASRGPEITGLQAIFDPGSATIEVDGIADDTRYSRGGVSEAPVDDPIHDIASVIVSLDVPPHLADQTFSLDLTSAGTIAGFSGELSPGEWLGEPRLLFVQAINSEGYAGVVEAAWVLERAAGVSPDAVSASLPPGQTATENLTITNLGGTSLEWSIATDIPASTLSGHDPALDETVQLDAFTLPGNSTVYTAFNAGSASRGDVIGFTFQGSVTGISGTPTWASDMAMTLTPPDGPAFSVGGYNTPHPPWDFDGSGSTSNGTYQSTHSGPDIFGDGGTGDEGEWFVDFTHTYNDSMSWSDVTMTLHKVEPPECADPATVSWLASIPDSGSLPAGEAITVSIAFDTTGLEPGEYAAQLCVTTSDPTLPLAVVPVALTVTDSTATISGHVTSMGYCQDDPAPLADAFVNINGQATTTAADGSYAVAVDAESAPVTVAFTHPDHRGQSEEVAELEVGQTVTVDADLVLRAACATVDPAALSFSLTAEGTAEQTLTVSNALGGSDLTWSLDTSEGCFDPAGIDWLSVSHTGGTIGWGNVREVTVSADAGGLPPGSHETTLCLVTDDAQQASLEVPVMLEVLEPLIFEDRFEATE